MNRQLSDLLFQTYSFAVCVLTATIGIRLFCEHSWTMAAAYGVATVASFYTGHFLVGLRQSVVARGIVRQDDPFAGH